MAAAKESQTCQQFTARNSSYLDHMALAQLDKNFSLPYFPPYKCTANAALPGQSSDLPSSNIGQQVAVSGFRKPLPPYCNILNPTGDPYLKDSQRVLPHGLGVVDKPVGASFAPQRRFLIFDQSENHTRLFFSPALSPLDQIFASKAPAFANGSFEKVVASQEDQHILKKPIVEEKWDENHLSDGEGEMLEDSDEIDALLYSDSDDDDGDDDDYDDDDDDSENDEVASTGHSPPLSLQEGYERDKLVDELTEEVTSSDEPRKRRRLLDDKYKKSSLESGERGNPCSYEDDVESRYAGERKLHDDDDDDLSKREMKVRIREALKMLESIIPGLDEKDPLSIIDGAVAYLKAMKSEAESEILDRGGGSSATSS